MMFDSKISNDISVAQIVDAMLIENEPPEHILDVLSCYSIDDIIDIATDCDRWFRVFQLDFIARIPDKHISFMTDMLVKFAEVANTMCMYTVWQLKSSYLDKSKFPRLEKIANEFLARTSAASRLAKPMLSHHPYRRSIEEQRTVDKALFDACGADDIIEEARVDAFKPDAFSKFIADAPQHSLFIYRILQDDFFIALSDLNKWAMLQSIIGNISCISPTAIMKFYKQILQNKAIDKNIRADAFKICIEMSEIPTAARSLLCTWNVTKDVEDILLQAKSYATLTIMLLSNGLHLSSNIAMLLVFIGKKYILKEWNDIDPDGMRKTFDIIDILDSADNF